ncbi:MAG: NTP transferase domain-containing protein [Gammaproteobacteria bacterium]|nr:NTP transferase domain-containing protein [Gammaproteobacteria bacterium]
MTSISAFIPVRLSSSRLPKKHLRDIGSKSLLSWVVWQLKQSQEVDNIVVCVPKEELGEYYLLKEAIRLEGVEYFEFNGDVNDVVGRLTAAAQEYSADICVLVSGDCPLVSPIVLDKLIEQMKLDDQCDIVGIDSHSGRRALVEGVVISRRWVWEKANMLSDEPYLREHQFPVISKKRAEFGNLGIRLVGLDESYYHLEHRMSVDTPSDLAFMRKLYEGLYNLGKKFSLENAIEYIGNNKEILAVNSHVAQKSMHVKSYKAAFLVSAVDVYGYGNLIRTLEVANTLLNEEGVGVKLFVFDDEAKGIVDDYGLPVEIYTKQYFYNNARFPFDVVIFDMNSEIIIDEGIIRALVEDKKKIIVVDNLNVPLQSVNKVIIPTAHFLGKDSDKVKSGWPFVVLDSRIQTGRYRRCNKLNRVLVYPTSKIPFSTFRARLFKLIRKCKVKKIKWQLKYEDGFHDALRKSKYFVSGFGLSSYEAYFLGVDFYVVGKDKKEEREIRRFRENISNMRRLKESGARRIAREIVTVLGV